MAQSSYAGATMLDLAKNFIEMFQKARQKESNKDRFMTISCDDYPGCIKTGWRENTMVMQEQLKRLQPTGTCSLESAVGRAFWFLNCNRYNPDYPGFGWCVAKPEPAVIIILTDGIFSLGPHFAPEKIKHPSSDFYKEVNRPDQKVFGVIFRIPARPSMIMSPFETATGGLANFCTSTGGKCFILNNSRHGGIAIDAILQKSQVLVKVNFSYTGPDIDSEVTKNGTNDDSNSRPEALAWKETCTGIIRIPRKDQEPRFFWPIPENFWIENNLHYLPQRPEYPKLAFTYDSRPTPLWKDGNLFDRYELEPSPLTQFILERQTGHYPVYVIGSGKKRKDYLCGYLVAEPLTKYATSENQRPNTVILYLTPYNYPTLLALMEECDKNNSKQLPAMLRQKIMDYISSVPVYYFVTLDLKPSIFRAMLRSKGTPDEDFSRCQYPHNVYKAITMWRQALRREYDLSVGTVHDILKKPFDPIAEIPRSKVGVETIFARYGPACHEYTGDGPSSFLIEHEPMPKMNPSAIFYSAKHIPRSQLIVSLTKIRANHNLYGRDSDLHVLQGGMPGQKIKLHDAEELHSRAIKVMGDYESYNRRLREIGFAPLREVVPPETTSHAFGNPFKLDKKVVAVDEIGEEGSPDTSQRASSPSSSSKSVLQKQRKRLDVRAFTRLRQRSGAYSETSSIASLSRSSTPFSDMEEAMELNGYDSQHKADIAAPNGATTTRGASPSPSIINGFTNISLKRSLSTEDSEDGSSSEASPSPAPKRKRGESVISANSPLKYKKLNEYKMEAVNIVKQLDNLTPSNAVSQLQNLCDKLLLSDKIAILSCAEETLKRLQRVPIYTAVVSYRRKLQSGL